jgi:SAM-dependent methyltransferase
MLPVSIDFNPTAADYAAYRPEFPEALFVRLAAMGAGLPGQQVVDLGTGTGGLARGFARRGCRVTGVDVAEALLGEARRRDSSAGVEIAYHVARAERTGLPAGCWDVVAAGQSWHWFNRPEAAAEARRLLGPAGRLVICHHDYLSRPGNVCAATEALILELNPRWKMAGSTGIYPAWTSDASQAGFERIETFSFDGAVEFSHEAWRGRMRTCNGIGASQPPEIVAQFDRALEQLLRERFPAEPLAVPHRVWAMLARVPASN